jgi:hypothetical protein
VSPQPQDMGARTSNIVFMVVGLVLVFIYVHARLHHHYEFYYDYYGGGVRLKHFLSTSWSLFFSWVV